MRFKKLLIFLLFIFLSILAYADCVDLSVATGYTISNMHNILLYSGNNPIALIKTFSFIYPGDNLQLLKNEVCDFDSSVFLLNGDEVIDINEVRRL